jgi:hypothetical protein
MRVLSANEIAHVSGGGQDEDIVVTAPFFGGGTSAVVGGGGSGPGASLAARLGLGFADSPHDLDGDGIPNEDDPDPLFPEEIVVTAPNLEPLPKGYVLAPFGNGKLMIAPDGKVHLTPEYARQVAQGPQIDWVGVATDLVQIVGSSVGVLGKAAAAIALPFVVGAETLKEVREAESIGHQR